MAAGQGDSAPTEDGLAQAQKALETLCRGYWYPIYVYVRRKGYNPDDAADLTQEFFAQLIRKEQLRLADRKKGKFRAFLLTMLDYFVAREWSRAHRQKRGGQFTFVSLDQQSPEERYQLEPKDNDTPEKKFEKQWALAVLKQAMEQLERESNADGKTVLFGVVKHLLSGEREVAVYGQIGARLKMSEGAVRVAVHRLRQRYGELVRSEIAQTVTEPGEIDEELQYLLRVLSR
jgi:RNA polymerase sigma factor (sigma-70 family)